MNSDTAIPNLADLPNDKAMKMLAEYVDKATDASCADQAQHALSLCNELAKRVQGTLAVELLYFKANVWSIMRKVKHRDESIIWQWDQSELFQEIYWLRSAIRSDDFENLTPFRQCQILVNAGNILSHIGRPIEAIEYWRRALNVLPKFAMAMGNLGFGYESYAKMLYDSGHAVIIFKNAYDLLSSVSNKNVVWDDYDFEATQQQMLDQASLISKNIDFSGLDKYSLDGFSLGKTKTEQKYRKWVLDYGLYINPLNDIGSHTIAAQDVLHLPSMVTDFGEPPCLIGFYNQLKQEYVSARYMLWQGITESEKYKRHFSDKEVLLMDTLDYTAYGVAIEQVKFAFRSAYSLFDKIAFFINDYWLLEIPEKKINFQSVWFEFKGGKKTNQLRHDFLQHPNLSLRGLYWLSKDFIEQDNTREQVLGQTMEPDADRLRTIRNYLEHKYLKVHDEVWVYGQDCQEPYFSDKLAYHLTSHELSGKTMRLMKLARAALIYLSLAIHQEERMKEKERSGITMPMTLPIWE